METEQERLKRLLRGEENTLSIIEEQRKEIDGLIQHQKNNISALKEKLSNCLNDDEDSIYKVEPDKSLIYNSKTNIDICMFFDEEGRDLLLKALNNL